MYTVYVVTNIVNGKYYVGQTTMTGIERWKEHYWSSNKKDYFHYAIKKYGKENFEVEEVAVFETREEVNNAEKLWILLTKSYDKKIGYNSTMGGEYGAIPNEETRVKIGNGRRGKLHTEETRKKMSEAHTGSKNHLYGLPPSQQPWFGKKLSDEHKAKCSQARKDWWARKRAENYDFEAYRDRISDTKTGVPRKKEVAA